MANLVESGPFRVCRSLFVQIRYFQELFRVWLVFYTRYVLVWLLKFSSGILIFYPHESSTGVSQVLSSIRGTMQAFALRPKLLFHGHQDICWMLLHGLSFSLLDDGLKFSLELLLAKQLESLFWFFRESLCLMYSSV